MMHWPGPCWKSKPRQEKDQIGAKRKETTAGKDDDEEDDPFEYAKDGMGKDEITSLRAETWRAMEDAYKQGKTRELILANMYCSLLRYLLLSNDQCTIVSLMLTQDQLQCPTSRNST